MFRRAATGPREVVLAYVHDNDQVFADPSVDVEKSDLRKYREALFAPESLEECIVFHPGERPTKWTIQPGTRRQKRYASALARTSAGEFIDAWLLFCVLRVGERVEVFGDGTERSLSIQPDRKDRGGDLGVSASEDWLDRVKLLDEERMGLSLMAQHITDPAVPLSRASAQPSGDAE